jgi:8-oxo-dGTP pyrophosphatase MutT (NUDIX family)
MSDKKPEYKITVTPNGDRIRHRVASILLDHKGGAVVDMEAYMQCPEFPGGGQDEGETVIQAALRETMEEAGWLAKDPYVFDLPGNWTYVATEAKDKKKLWNMEENIVVVSTAVGFHPDKTFGSEHDALKCEVVAIETIIAALSKRITYNMTDRFRIKNMMILEVLKRLSDVSGRSPKWTRW